MGRLSFKDFFWQDVLKIQNACKQSDILREQAKNLRSAGDEVEIAVRDIFKEKLAPKYYVTTGHIVDEELNVSSQLDLIIADNIKSPVLATLSDNTQHIFYETVYGYGEVKKSWYKDGLLTDFSKNLKTIKTTFNREDIAANILECGDNQLRVKNEVTVNPKRNMLFTFMLMAEGSANLEKIAKTLNETENAYLPNIIVFIGAGVIVNVSKALYELNKVEINLYPELVKEDEGVWVYIGMSEPNQVLTYIYMLLLEHLKQTIVTTPDIQNYTKKLLTIESSDIHKL